MAKRRRRAGSPPRPPVQVGDVEIAPGRRHSLELPVARLATGTWVHLPVVVVHGTREGARLGLTAAIHGDEINGVAVIQRVLADLDPEAVRGTVIAVPIVNAFGFIEQSRYLPDRRDLNRSFPGSPRGSLAAQLAHLLMTEVMSKCDYAVDLHTGSNHRINLPHVRADLNDSETRECALAFGTRLAMHSRLRDGSLRAAASAVGVRILLYEGGEALRFNRRAIAAGVAGIHRLMAHLDMVDDAPTRDGPMLEAARSTWVRARRSGILRLRVRLGDMVEAHQTLATISDVFGDAELAVGAPADGLVIAHTSNPLVNRGDALFHLADVRQTS